MKQHKKGIKQSIEIKINKYLWAKGKNKKKILYERLARSDCRTLDDM